MTFRTVSRTMTAVITREVVTRLARMNISQDGKLLSEAGAKVCSG